MTNPARPSGPAAPRLSGRVLVIGAAVLWLAFVITLIVVLVLWHTTPMHPVDLGG